MAGQAGHEHAHHLFQPGLLVMRVCAGQDGWMADEVTIQPVIVEDRPAQERGRGVLGQTVGYVAH